MCQRFAWGLAVALAVGAAKAEDMPFWGENSPQTNRVAASFPSVAVARFNSRRCFVRTAVLPKFSSQKLGMLIILK